MNIFRLLQRLKKKNEPLCQLYFLLFSWENRYIESTVALGAAVMDSRRPLR